MFLLLGSFGSTKQRVARARSSSEPFPITMFSGLQLWNSAKAFRNGFAVGFG